MRSQLVTRKHFKKVIAKFVSFSSCLLLLLVFSFHLFSILLRKIFGFSLTLNSKYKIGTFNRRVSGNAVTPDQSQNWINKSNFAFFFVAVRAPNWITNGAPTTPLNIRILFCFGLSLFLFASRSDEACPSFFMCACCWCIHVLYKYKAAPKYVSVCLCVCVCLCVRSLFLHRCNAIQLQHLWEKYQSNQSLWQINRNL